jgi:transposase-like protein
MKGKRHSPEQIIAKLREADALLATGATLGQICQKLAIAEQTFHRWRNQYGGMKAKDAKRLKELEQENARLKKLLADAHLDNDILRSALDHLGKE